MTQGRWLWALGFDKQFKRPPEFELTVEGPVLVLVDDPEYRLDAPRTRTDLARKIGAHLKNHEAVPWIVRENTSMRSAAEQIRI